MAQGWKRIVEVGLSRSGATRIIARATGPSSLVLAYHNIVPLGEDAVGDLSLHVDQATFGDHLDLIVEHARVVPLEEAVALRAERDEETRVAITFDDAYVGTMTAGMEELRRRGLPSTVFVPPGLLGSDGFWWDRVAEPGHPLEEGARDHALWRLRGVGEEILAWARAEGMTLQEMPAHARPVSERVVASLDDPLVRFGAHTWSHPNLAALDPDARTVELERSRSWLMERTDRYVDWLAYPYGLVDDEVVAMAAGLFGGAVLVSGGAVEARGDLRGGGGRTPRLNVPRGLTLDGLRLRLCGLS